VDIHKPKPWHGLREFLKEYAIIVVGVLTALLAEQVVEALHHHALVRAAEESLRDNFLRFVAFKGQLDVENACMAKRAAELRGLLDQAARTGHLPAIEPIPQPMPHPWQIDTWDAIVASQTAPYIPADRVILYSRVAMSAVDVYADANAEAAEWGALQALAGASRPFGDAEQANARAALARAMSKAELVATITGNTMPRLAAAGLLSADEIKRALNAGHRHNPGPAMCRPIQSQRS